MAKRYKNNELRGALLGNFVNTAKERTISAVLLAVTAALASALLGALKNDAASDEAEIFRE